MSTSTFDASGSGKGNKTKQPKPTRTSAQWDPEAKRVFISLCEEEIIAGRRPGSHFTPEGWKNIVEGFYSITGRQYSKAQFKNQWDTMKAEFVIFNELMNRETDIGIDPVTNTIDAPSEWWDRKIKRSRCLPIPASLPDFVRRNICHRAHLRTPSTVSQVGANSSAPSQAEDYQDADPDEGEGSDESNGPVDVPNCQTAMSQDEEIGRGTSSGKRKSSGGPRRATKKKSGPEMLSASINNLVSCCREVSDRRTPPSSDVSSISECIRTVRNLPGIERGSDLYFYSVQYMRNQDNRALFSDMETPEEKLGLLRYLFDRFPLVSAIGYVTYYYGSYPVTII
ncbi:L10-interacting MYB domain-containing protein-like [Abeliophyllum distichum]|uniref:L10-interacting MYB domain-containing protein-like n=1 Tax=Abeliophyllum distichum TaxID=126358 RepID=A0ABD1PEN0_9LAMI